MGKRKENKLLRKAVNLPKASVILLSLNRMHKQINKEVNRSKSKVMREEFKAEVEKCIKIVRSYYSLINKNTYAVQGILDNIQKLNMRIDALVMKDGE